MNFSSQELITHTKQKLKETFVEKNQRIELLINTLAYLVMNNVGLEEMKILMKDLNETLDNS